ncbi:short chain oxidoreductase [Hymenopellis radicata]|nr:short chain oxidoreductase [Hymenopellis radicata]
MSTSKGVAIVTGSAQGIGKGIAIRLAQDGYDVAINDLPAKKEKLEQVAADITARTGRRVSIQIADVSEEEQVKGMIQDVVKTLGGLDVMIANAGVCIPCTLLNMDVKTWDWLFATNLRSMMLCYKYAAVQMIEQGRGGRIIGASSLAGKQGGPSMGMYGATKFGIRGLTQSVATELGEHGITPKTSTGLTDTEALYSAEAAHAGVDVQALFAAVGTVEDVAGLISFLVTKDARLITGQTVSLSQFITADCKKDGTYGRLRIQIGVYRTSDRS